MKIRLSVFLPIIFSVIFIKAQDKGETSFKQICAACHTIGKGRLVGPDLANVDKRHPEAWIIKFVKSSQSVIKGGDKYADSLFKAFNQVPMPDRPDLTDEQIKDIIAFIKTNSPAISITAAVTAAVTSTAAPIITGDAKRGQDLFVGNIRFANNGPTCNSCHNVEKAGIITGGAMAKDLTDLPKRMNADGVKSTITGMLGGIPAMKQSFGNHPLTEEEISDIAAFLASPPQTQEQPASSEANIMIWGGIIGAGALILILFPVFWIRRKQRTVNHAIYERQTKSFH